MTFQIETSETTGKIYEALAKAQGEMGSIAKNAVAEAGTNRARTYADLASALEAARPSLSSNGIALMQPAGRDAQGHVVVITRFGHKSGEWIQASISSDTQGLSQRGVQAIGTVITYLRRYSLMALCGLAPDDDDDGEASSKASRARKPPTQRLPKKPATRKKAEPKPANPKHHESFTEAEQKRFCAALPGEFDGLTYKDVADFQTAHGKARPSAMDKPTRLGFWGWLKEGGVVEVREWMARVALDEQAA